MPQDETLLFILLNIFILSMLALRLRFTARNRRLAEEQEKWLP